MKEIKLTLQDYKNAINLWNEWQYATIVKSFPKYMEEKIDELEQPEIPMYRCIKLPPANNGMFKIGNLYADTYWGAGLCLSDLPNHFELNEPETKPEKITWNEVVALIEKFKRKEFFLSQDFYIEILKTICQIKTDHLS